MENESETEKPIVHVCFENLSCDSTEDDLTNNLLYLLKRALHLDVNRNDIEIKGDTSKQAVIQVAESETLQSCVDRLNSSEGRSKFQFNFPSILNPSVDLKVYILKNNLSDTDIQVVDDSNTQAEKQSDSSVSSVQEVTVTGVPSVAEDTDVSKVPDKSLDKTNTGVSQSIRYLSDTWGVRSFKTTSFRSQIPLTRRKENAKYYLEGETLGKQSSCTSFIDETAEDVLITAVPEYVCGFLNSNHSGTVYVGVTDDGCVSGLRCDRPNDAIQRTIEDAIDVIRPPIDSHLYTTEFTPVYDKFGEVKGTGLETYKVIEVSIQRTINLYQLYEVNGEVFSRKNGSHYRMNPPEIKEWYHIKQLHQEELENALRRQKLDFDNTKEFEKKILEKEKAAEINALIAENEALIKTLKEEKNYEMQEALKTQKQDLEGKGKEERQCMLTKKDSEMKLYLEEKTREHKQALEAQRMEYEIKIDNERNKIFSDKDDEFQSRMLEKDEEMKKALQDLKLEQEKLFEEEKKKLLQEKQDQYDKLQEEKEQEISELKSQLEEMKAEKERAKSKTCIIM